MKTYETANHETTDQIQVGRPVAPEDLRRGDFVSVLSEIVEFPSFLWNQDSQLLTPHEPVRIEWHPEDGGTPLKIKAICLPFVSVKVPNDHRRTLDVRQCRLVRLSSDYVYSVWKSLKNKKRKKSRKA